jgi:hypothetical protein
LEAVVPASEAVLSDSLVTKKSSAAGGSESSGVNFYFSFAIH